MSQQPQHPTQQPTTPPPRATPAGSGFMGWLGRQIGYVKKAIDTDVTAPQVVYRKLDVREQRHPAHANVTLRRTTIDEAIVTRRLPAAQGPQQPTPPREQGGRPAEQSGGGGR